MPELVRPLVACFGRSTRSKMHTEGDAMERPCGGDPECLSDNICMGCGADGPMNWFYNQCAQAEDDGDGEDDE